APQRRGARPAAERGVQWEAMTNDQMGAVLAFVAGLGIAVGIFIIRHEVKRPEDRVALFVIGGLGLYIALVAALTGLNLVSDLWFHLLWAGILPPFIWLTANQ